MKKNKKNFKDDFDSSELDALNEELSSEDNGSQQAPLSKAERRVIKATKRKVLDRSTLDPYDQSDLAEAKRYAKKNKLKVIFVTATIVLLVAVIATVAAVLIIQQQGKPSTADYQVEIGDNEPYELSYKKANAYGEFYFDLRSIAKYSELIVSGSDDRLKFTCADGTYVRFVNGSSTATVNGEAVKVGGKVYITPSTDKKDGECLVPFRFIEKLFSYKKDGRSVGMSVKLSSNNKLRIHRMSYSNGTYPPISFSSDCFEYASDMQLSSYPTPDLDARTAAALCASKLTLVNKSHPLDEGKISINGLVSLNELKCPLADGLEEYDNKDFFDPTAALALIAMLNEANKTLEGGDKILVSSAYRSFSYQKGLHQKYIDAYVDEHDVSEEEAAAQTVLLSAPAGKSEHHTGLCVDLVESRAQYRELDESFEDTEAFIWLSKNAHKYGFILRYPKDKTDITKYSYEPWHYRFVGVYAAGIIYEDGITLEEYLAELY